MSDSGLRLYRAALIGSVDDRRRIKVFVVDHDGGELLGLARAEVDALAVDVAPVGLRPRIWRQFRPGLGTPRNRRVEANPKEDRIVPVSGEFGAVEKDAIEDQHSVGFRDPLWRARRQILYVIESRRPIAAAPTSTQRVEQNP